MKDALDKAIKNIDKIGINEAIKKAIDKHRNRIMRVVEKVPLIPNKDVANNYLGNSLDQIRNDIKKEYDKLVGPGADFINAHKKIDKFIDDYIERNIRFKK